MAAVYNPQQASNLNTTGANKTTAYFNNFNDPKAGISPDVNDEILSYFEQQTGGDTASAKILVQTIIDTAKAQREDPIKVLDQFKKVPIGDLTGTLALYLNSTRVNTSLLGIKVAPKTNRFVTRTILP
jgi:hypothetical protein